MSQITLEQSGILPKKRSKNSINPNQKYLTEYTENYKPFFQKKELTDKQKH